MSPSGFSIGAGFVLAFAVVRTLLAVALSFRQHRRGDAASRLALSSLADGILVIGAIHYARGELVDDVRRPLFAALLVYAVTWESFAGMSRIDADNSEYLQAPGGDLTPVHDFIVVGEKAAWAITTGMLALIAGSYVAGEVENINPPLAGVLLPVAVGYWLRQYIDRRTHDGWTRHDTVVLAAAVTALALSVAEWF